MDELNDLIAAMPDGSTLTLDPAQRYELSGDIKIIGKHGFTLKLNRAEIVSPRGLAFDITGSSHCTIDCAGATLGPPPDTRRYSAPIEDETG